MAKLHFTIINLQKHLERTFDLWNIKKPDLKTQLKRSSIFLAALLTTIFWPINDPIITGTLLTLAWIMLALINKPVLRYLLLLNLMLDIRYLFELTNYFLRFLAPG